MKTFLNLIGVAVMLIVGFYAIMALIAVLVVMFVPNGTEEEKSGLSPFEWSASQQFESLQRRYECGVEGMSPLIGFDCDSTYQEWLETPAGGKWAFERAKSKAHGKWFVEFETRKVNKNGDVYVTPARKSGVPCVFEYKGKTYKCA